MERLKVGKTPSFLCQKQGTLVHLSHTYSPTESSNIHVSLALSTCQTAYAHSRRYPRAPTSERPVGGYEEKAANDVRAMLEAPLVCIGRNGGTLRPSSIVLALEDLCEKGTAYRLP